MNLREFSVADKAEFLEMCEDFYGPSGATLEPIPVAQMSRTFDRIVAGSPYAKGYMIEEDGLHCGYGLIYPFYSNEAGGVCLMLEEIYIKPEFRGRQLGTKYLNQIAGMFDDDVVGLKLEICPANPRARKLYESVGFHELGYRTMIKELSGKK